MFRFRQDYIRNRNLMEWSFLNHADPSEIVDIILTQDLASMRVTRVHVRNQLVKVASIEDLMRMKRAAGRPKDVVGLQWLGAVRDEIEGRR